MSKVKYRVATKIVHGSIDLSTLSSPPRAEHASSLLVGYALTNICRATRILH